ncbi:MAG: SDR family NAD(P)-dependent oxidoreductase [Vicinamibacterales bacterium]
MNLGLANRIVLITGGSKGIGRACARAFAEEGARVAIAARRTEDLERARGALAAEGLHVMIVAADLTEAANATALVAEVERALGPIDVLVNSAGGARRHTVETLDAAAWAQGMSAKYFPYVHAISAVKPGMMARRSGAIVSIVGSGGKTADTQHLSGGAANAALMLATVGLAAALGPSGVRVNAINPGLTSTERLDAALTLESQTTGLSKAELMERNQARIPLGRYATPEDIASVAVFLASDRAGYVTGAVVPMAGGAFPVI